MRSSTSFRIPTTTIREELLRAAPHVVVTFPIHGISGFPDHLVTHFAVTRVYLELHGPEYPWLQRLAFFTLSPRQPSSHGT